jgi:murein DD-endopeptidase MepM/ murein hydrolase activator NlpD
MRARLAAAGLLALAAGFGASAAQAAVVPPSSSARALAIRVVLPDGSKEALAEATAPPARQVTAGELDWRDGTITTRTVWSRARADAGKSSASSWATSTVRAVSLFGGEITIGAISTKATARAGAKGADGGLGGSWLAEVTILGERVRPSANARVQLADWGYAVLLEQAIVRDARRVGRRTFVTGLHVYLTADHGGLPAGTELLVGYAEAAASVPRSQATPPPPPQSGAPLAPPKGPKRDPDPKPPTSPPSKPPPAVQNPPANVRPDITNAGYVFPVYGPSSFTNDFAASRAITGWHHGNDIFAPVGAPVLAVTEGTLFLVGWNDVGGNRVWLRDKQGNEFYFAHLSAFSPLAFEGSQVKAGDVIGFVGATGDAVGTPPHLHFEVHPAALLGLGYDGVINPYPYLLAWRRVADATFDWGAADPGEAPPPGAVILQAEDISAASGLDPAALTELLELPPFLGEPATPPEPVVVGAEPGFTRRG